MAVTYTHSILKAMHTESARAIAGDHAGIAASEAEAASIRAALRTAPIEAEAEGTDIVERTIAEVAAARHGQFKRRGKSPCSIITAPT